MSNEQRLDQLRQQAWKEGVVAGKGVDVAGGPIPRKPGYYGQPVVKPPVWTWQVPLYFFFGGIAGMSAVIASGAIIFHHFDLALAAMWIVSPIATCLFVALALVYYARMSLAMAVGMLAMAALMIIPVPLLGENALLIAAVVFVLAWIGQFIGHAVEGRKPKFLQDLQFLLIGPAWILRFVYRGVGIRY